MDGPWVTLLPRPSNAALRAIPAPHAHGSVHCVDRKNVNATARRAGISRGPAAKRAAWTFTRTPWRHCSDAKGGVANPCRSDASLRPCLGSIATGDDCNGMTCAANLGSRIADSRHARRSVWATRPMPYARALRSFTRQAVKRRGRACSLAICITLTCVRAECPRSSELP